nr:HTTM domain-containing protein [Lysobacter sp. CAU 1642]
MALLRPLIAIDLRSLALFRVVIAFAVLLNVGLYWPDAVALFADEGGLYPRSMAMEVQRDFRWSPLLMAGHPAFLHAFFALNALAGLALLLGWRTRAATVLCWLCALALKYRAAQFVSLADTQLPILLFWGMFLPLAARFSIDAALCRPEERRRDVASVASLAVLLNVMYLYFVGALEKTGSSWQQDSLAVYYAVTSVESTSPLAAWLAAYPGLAGALTEFVYAVELGAPLLLFLPFLTQWARLVGVPLLMSLHLAFVLFLSIGIFPWVSLSGLCLFLPPLLWDRLLRPWLDRPARRGIVMYFDRGCGFCEKTCRIFRAFGMHPDTRIEVAQDTPAVGAVLERENSWVVRGHDGVQRLRWDAVAYVWRRSPLLAPLGWLFALPGLRQFGNGLYRLIAALRPALARLSATALAWQTPPAFAPGRTASLMLAVLIPLSAWSCLQYPLKDSLPRMPAWARAPLDLLALGQRWNMYAPNATRSSRWVVAEGWVAGGAPVDVLQLSREAPSHDRPADGYALYRTFRWRKLFSRIDWNEQGPRLGALHCRSWNAAHPDLPVLGIRYSVYRQRTAPPGKAPGEIRRLRQFEYLCHDPGRDELDVLLDELR